MMITNIYDDRNKFLNVQLFISLDDDSTFDV